MPKSAVSMPPQTPYNAYLNARGERVDHAQVVQFKNEERKKKSNRGEMLRFMPMRSNCIAHDINELMLPSSQFLFKLQHVRRGRIVTHQDIRRDAPLWSSIDAEVAGRMGAGRMAAVAGADTAFGLTSKSDTS